MSLVDEGGFKTPSKDEGFRKFDQGKRPWGLIPWDALGKVLDVFHYGSGKYGPRNWENGTDYQRVFDALLRHLTDWWMRIDKGKGPGRDADTGYSDLWHASCNILFLITFELRQIGIDNRPTQVKSQETVEKTKFIFNELDAKTVSLLEPKDPTGW